MKTKTLFIILCLAAVSALQTVQSQNSDDKVYDMVDTPPTFPGGAEAMLQYLSNSVVYPVEAQAKSIQGRVVVQFVVDKNGNLTTPQVIRGIDPLLDKEALRVVSSMPAWSPGLLKGKAVNTRFTLPIMFRLTNDVKNTSTPNNMEKTPEKAYRLDGFWQFKGQQVGGSPFQPPRIYTAKILLNGSFKTFNVVENKTSISGEGSFEVVSDDTYIETITNHMNTTLIGKSQKMEYRLEGNMLYVKFFIEKSNLGTDLNMWYEEVWERVDLQSHSPIVASKPVLDISFVAPNYETIEANIKDNKSDMYYPVLMKRFLNSDSTLTIENKRHLYYGYVFQDSYSPYKNSEYLDSIKQVKSKADLREADMRKIVEFADKALADNPFDTNAYYDKMEVLHMLKDMPAFYKTAKQYGMILEAITSSGRGATKETAFHVIAVAHEYALINGLGLQRAEQQLINHYDYIKFKPNAHGIEGFYFDISQCFNSLSKSLKKN